MSGGFGAGPWGVLPWGGGTALPEPPEDTNDFDLFCFSEAGLPAILADIDVNVVDGGGQLTVGGVTGDLEFRSGGSNSTDDVRLSLVKAVPQSWTLQFTLYFVALPNNFGDLASNHIFVGATDSAGPCAGLFFSKAGVAYTGGVSHDGLGNINLDSTIETLPGSAAFIEEDKYITFRIAVDTETSAAYIYITASDEVPITGHRLRYVMPAIHASELINTPIDRSLISVRGTASSASYVNLDTFCMGAGLIIPNLPPRADAGKDQAARMCSVVRLDGSASFDPEESPLAYIWTLIDAPPDSVFATEADDGVTLPEATPTGFTDRVYSAEAAVANAADPFDIGDVILFKGNSYSLSAVGTDINGFYLQTTASVIPDSVSSSFKVLRQRGISGADTVNPTFLPDVPGLYKFDLIVSDGDLLSDESLTVVNVLESAVPYGCMPDLGFVFGYLSDFWKLVEDRERLETYFQSLAQVAASELLTLWQVDYSKSLRDIQRTIQRRWLHYDLVLAEPVPEMTVLRQVRGGVLSAPIASGGESGVSGTSLVLTSEVLEDDLVINITSSDPVTASDLTDELNAKLGLLDSRFTAIYIPTSGGAGYVRLDSTITFSIGTGTTCPLWSLGAVNGGPKGIDGVKIGARTYKVSVSLEGLDIRDGDVLSVGDPANGFRIANIIDNPSDTLRYQRVVLHEDMPVNPGASWGVYGHITSRFLDFHAGLVSSGDIVTVELVDSTENSSSLLNVRAVSSVEASSGQLCADLDSIDIYLSQPTRYSIRLARIVRRRYLPIHSLISDVPMLQEHIKVAGEEQLIRRNVDFFIDEVRGQSCLRFIVGDAPDNDVWEYQVPPDRLWAETTYIDNKLTIEGNFGIQAGFTLDNLEDLSSNLDYLSAVRGLWYAYLRGPTLFNLRAGTQILLGLPFAEEAGVIDEIRKDFSPNQGRILVHDLNQPEVVRSYYFPGVLDLEINPNTKNRYTVGDEVRQFAPLVEGAEVLDYVKDSRWFEGLVNQGTFFEIEKFHRFLVRVDSAAFSLSSLFFVKNFIIKVKPTYTLPMFIVRKDIADTEISVTDDITYNGRLFLIDGACFDEYGTATHWDQPRSAGGGYQSDYDGNADPDDAPVESLYPTSQAVSWGFDKKYLCPLDEITLTGITDFAGGTVDYEGIWSYGEDVAPCHEFDHGPVTSVPSGPAGLTLTGSPSTVGEAGTIDILYFHIAGDLDGDSASYEVVVSVNGGDVDTITLTPPPNDSGGYWLVALSGTAVVATDTVSVRIRPVSGSTTPNWAMVYARVLQSDVTWSNGGSLGAGKYCKSVTEINTLGY